jgi:DNA polymerase-3 subunit alpha
MDLSIIQPNINTSDFNFLSLDNKSILFGLGAIKGVGYNAVMHIINERKKNGHFKNIFDFCERVSLTTINIGTLDSLIYSGSFDCFGESRLSLKNVLDKAIKYGQQKQNTKNMGQHELFENKSESYSDTIINDQVQVERETIESRLKSFNLEKKVLGFYLTGHPVDEYRDEIKSMSIKDINSYFHDFYSNPTDSFSELATVCGVIINSRIQRMGQDRFINILTIDDSSHRLEIIVYPDIYEKYQSLIKENEILFISGVIAIDEYNGDLSMKANKIIDLDSARQQFSKEVEIFLSSEFINDKTLAKVVSLLEPHKNGKCPLTIKCLSQKHIVPLNLDQEWFVNPSSMLINNLSDLLGKENIIVKYQ